MHRYAAGIDEAGRGPLAGPVVAAAVVLDRGNPISGLDDSKKLTATQRDELFERITEGAIAYGIASVDAAKIDEINILQASLLAMRNAFASLDFDVGEAWIDGNQEPSLPVPTHTLVGGDGIRADIGAASILAKVSRDRIMGKYANQFPGYGFEHNMGYPTSLHLQRLRELGPCAIHRRSFAPVRDLLSELGF